MTTRHLTAALATVTFVLAACASDAGSSSSTSAGAVTEPTTENTIPTDMNVAPGAMFPEARCEANKAAGKVTYLSGFDFAATASIIDVIVAQDKGYYDDMCLDVEVLAGNSTANYPLMASGKAQFSSGGSFSEVVEFSAANQADFVATAVEGRTPIDSLIAKPDKATSLVDLKGQTIGVKAKLPPSVEAMLLKEGLVKDKDYKTVLLDGYDPLAHWAIDSIAGFPGYQSNEPGALTRAGITFDLYRPQDYGIPGSFGVIYTTRTFIDQHPTAAQDFIRATMLGLADAVSDPDAAAQAAVNRINAGGNPYFLSPEGEVFRWNTDAKLITGGTPSGAPLGVPDTAALQSELDAYDAIGVFGNIPAPKAGPNLDNTIIDGVYGADGNVIWPG